MHAFPKYVPLCVVVWLKINQIIVAMLLKIENKSLASENLLCLIVLSIDNFLCS